MRDEICPCCHKKIDQRAEGEGCCYCLANEYEMYPELEKEKNNNGNKLELIDEKIEIELDKFSIQDFELMYGLIKWCNSYTRDNRFIFHLLKDFLSFMVFIEMDGEIYYYVKKFTCYFRKPKHRLEMEEKAIQEFKDFILKKFKKGNPTFKIIEEKENDKTI